MAAPARLHVGEGHPAHRRPRRRVARIQVELRRDIVVPAAIRAGEMVVSVVALVLLDASPSVLARLTSWDSAYYADITLLGYPDDIVTVGDRLAEGSRFAFSPLFPLLTAAVRVLGLSTPVSQVVVAGVAGLAASIGVHLLGREVGGSRRAGYVACAALGALPMAITLQMGYAESLALAFGAFSLLATMRHRWWLAAGLALVAGLARPSGGLVALAIPLAAWGLRRSVTWPRVVGATAVGLAGLPLYWVYIWARTGVVDGWFVVQRVGWSTHFDFGAATVEFISGNTGWENFVMSGLTLVTFAAYLVALLVAVRHHGLHPLVVVSLAAVVLALGSSNFWFSKARLLLAAFPLVVLLARPLVRLRTSTLVLGLCVAVAASAWWSAYGLTRWPHTI